MNTRQSSYLAAAINYDGDPIAPHCEHDAPDAPCACIACPACGGDGHFNNHERLCEACDASGSIDPDVCPDCGTRNTNTLDGSTHECYDCGQTYTA